MRQESLGRPFRRANTITAQAPINCQGNTEMQAASQKVPTRAQAWAMAWFMAKEGKRVRLDREAGAWRVRVSKQTQH